jgi:hypothetical protein
LPRRDVNQQPVRPVERGRGDSGGCDLSPDGEVCLLGGVGVDVSRRSAAMTSTAGSSGRRSGDARPGGDRITALVGGRSSAGTSKGRSSSVIARSTSTALGVEPLLGGDAVGGLSRSMPFPAGNDAGVFGQIAA